MCWNVETNICKVYSKTLCRCPNVKTDSPLLRYHVKRE